jgi:DNA modification methylase
MTWHRVIFGDSRNMREIAPGSIHLMVTSPPYYNAPFDYPGLFSSYDEFLQVMEAVATELLRVLAEGRVCAFVTDDMLVKGEKYPVVSDITKIMVRAGFRYRDKIVWRKPEGYTRISRRSGVVLQHPYPMYFYPDNIQESILIFQKGRFNYDLIKKMPAEILERSHVDTREFQLYKWNLTVWDITNVLPVEGRVEQGIAAFPEEIPKRLIRLFSFVGENVLDPFLGSGTTTKVAMQLGRNSYGYEIDLELRDVILRKLGCTSTNLIASQDAIEIIERDDARRLRTFLQEKVKNQRSVTKRRAKRRSANLNTYPAWMLPKTDSHESV